MSTKQRNVPYVKLPKWLKEVCNMDYQHTGVEAVERGLEVKEERKLVWLKTYTL